MTRTKLGRTLVGAALTVVLSTFTLAPAHAEAYPDISWDATITDGATYTYGEVPAEADQGCIATEEGVAVECLVTGYSAELGTHELVATAVSATNELLVSRLTMTYTVASRYSYGNGFLPPAKDGKTYKAGRAIPLKFKLWAGEDKAKDAAVVTGIMAQQVDCTTTAPLADAVAVTGNGKGTQLKFHDGAFHQKWKTGKLPKPEKAKGKKTRTMACYLVTVSLDDGSSFNAQFQLR